MGIAKSQSGGGTDHFLGTFVSLVALQTAHPTATLGDYAIVEALPSDDAIVYFWDGANWDTTYISANFLLAANNLSDVPNNITGRTNLGMIDISLAADFTQTSSTLTDLTGFTIPVLASEKYKGFLCLAITGSTGGLRIGFTFPTSCVVKVAYLGSSTAVTAQTMTWVTAATGTEIAFTLASNSAIGSGYFMISIANGANAGNVQVQVKSVTNTQSNVLTADLTSLEYRRTA